MSQSSASASDYIEGDTIYHTGASAGISEKTVWVALAVAALVVIVWFYNKK